MQVYFSMFLWVWVMYGVNQFITSKNKFAANEGRIGLWVALATMGYIVFWASIRTGVIDTRSYINSFQAVEGSWSNLFQTLQTPAKAAGWNLLVVVFKLFISKNFTAWFTFVATVSGLCVATTLRRYSVSFFLSMFLFLGMLHFTWLFNGIRQFLVACILFAATPLLEKEKNAHYILLCCLLTFVHFTCFIMIPVGLLASREMRSKWIAFFVLAIIASVFSMNYVVDLTEEMLSNTFYAGFSAQFANDDGAHIFRFLASAAPVALFFVFRKSYCNIMIPKYIKISIVMSVVTASLYLIASQTSGIMVGRLPIYTDLYNLVLIPWLVKNFPRKNIQPLLNLLVIGSYVVFYYLQMGHFYYISDLTGLLPGYLD